MRFRARLYFLIATGVPSAGTLLYTKRAFAQAGIAEQIGERAAREAPIMVVVVLLIVAAAAWRDHMKDKRLAAERERLEEFQRAERLRHEDAMGKAVDRFLSVMDRNAKATEEQAVAQERSSIALAGVAKELNDLRMAHQSGTARRRADG